MTVYLLGALGFVGLLAWFWRTNREPLVYLVPPALAFSPLVRYAGETLGWPGAWVSVRKMLVLTLAISFGFRLLKGDYAWRRIPGMAFVAPYLSLVVLSVLWSVIGPSKSDPAEILNEFIDWAVPVAVFFSLAASPSSERRILSAGRVMGFTVLIVAIYCGLQALVLLGQANFVPGPVVELTQQGRQDFWWASSRLYGPFATAGPNALGVFLLLPAAYAANRVVDTTGSVRVGWTLVVLLAAAVIAGTYSRAAQLGLIVILTILPLLRRSPRGVVVISVCALIAVGLLAETTIGQHFRSLYGGGDRFDPDVGYRLRVWRVILGQFADHPFGLGFDGWLRTSQHLVVAGVSTLPGTAQPGAGQWMRELADRGVAGVLFLLLMMTGLIVLTAHRARLSRWRGVIQSFLMAAAVGFAGWMVAFISDDYLVLNAVAGMFWYIAGAALAAIRDDSDGLTAISGPADPPDGADAAASLPRLPVAGTFSHHD